VNKLPFREFCRRLDKVSAEGKSQKKMDIMLPRELGQKLQGENMFPLFRLILPQLDRDRNTYGIKDKMMAKLYTECLGLSEQNKDAILLKNFKDPNQVGSSARGAGSSANVGDFTSVLEEVLQRRAGAQGKKTIKDVNDLLDLLWLANGGEAKKVAKV
jgi:DNA ligase-4